jgi:hypothetical protein
MSNPNIANSLIGSVDVIPGAKPVPLERFKLSPIIDKWESENSAKTGMSK